MFNEQRQHFVYQHGCIIHYPAGCCWEQRATGAGADKMTSLTATYAIRSFSGEESQGRRDDQGGASPARTLYGWVSDSYRVRAGLAPALEAGRFPLQCIAYH